MNTSSGTRLNKFISESGFCSRREADKLIEANRVAINGKRSELGTRVMPGDVVLVDGKRIDASPENKSDRVYLAYNKPIGITCTTERHVKGNIIDDIGHQERIFPIGRLDKPSEGLIFLTSDGDIVNKILRAENAHDKEYLVTVDKPLSERFVTRMSKGIPILNTVTKPCKVSVQSRFVFKIILTQGLNRQIRRMCEYLDYEVVKLKRVRIMNVSLAGLKPGQWRSLTEQEMEEINGSVAHSDKTAPEGKKKIPQYKSAQPKRAPHARSGSPEQSSYRESTSETNKFERNRPENGFEKSKSARKNPGAIVKGEKSQGIKGENQRKTQAKRNSENHISGDKKTFSPWGKGRSK